MNCDGAPMVVCPADSYYGRIGHSGAKLDQSKDGAQSVSIGDGSLRVTWGIPSRLSGKGLWHNPCWDILFSFFRDLEIAGDASLRCHYSLVTQNWTQVRCAQA
jgi:hypothetical protein